MDKWKYIEKEDLNFFFFLNSLREKKKKKTKNVLHMALKILKLCIKNLMIYDYKMSLTKMKMFKIDKSNYIEKEDLK